MKGKQAPGSQIEAVFFLIYCKSISILVTVNFPLRDYCVLLFVGANVVSSLKRKVVVCGVLVRAAVSSEKRTAPAYYCGKTKGS